MSTLHPLITIDPGRRGGRACVRNLRISVGDVLGWLARGMSPVEIMADYPELTHAVIQAMRHLPDLHLHVFAPRNLGATPDNVTHHKVNLTADIAAEVINKAIIHVLPSQYEGFGHMLNEAAACDARIVTTDHEPMRMFDDRFLVKVSGSKRQGLSLIHI